jgi:predicted  nucleic acid-binding Zn-ribbon protein
MIDLASLWELEKHRESLNSLKTELKLLMEKTKLLNLEKRFQEIEQTHRDLLLKMEDTKHLIRKLEQEVDVHKDKHKSAEVTLYNGSVKDIKQLEHLEKEKEYHLKLVDDLEDKIIDAMGLSEDTQSRIDKISRLLKRTKRDMIEKQQLAHEKSTRLSYEIQIEEREIEDLEEIIDGQLLTLYNDIRGRKGSGMALMKNDVCNGCHMHIPEKIVEKARQGKSAVTCENCGRILYHEPEGEDI